MQDVVDSAVVSSYFAATHSWIELSPMSAPATPFLKNIQGTGTDRTSATAVVSPEMSIARDHQLDGIPLVPAAILLELCAETAVSLLPAGDWLGVSGFRVLTGVRFYDDRPQILTVEAARDANGNSVACQVTGEYVDRRSGERDPHRVYAECTLETVPPLTGPLQLSEMVEFASLLPADSSSHDPARAGTVFHGPAWSALTGLAAFTPNHALFRIDLRMLPAEVRSRAESETTASPVVDALLQACDVLAFRSLGTSQLPAGAERMVLHRKLGELEQPLLAEVAADGEGRRFTIRVWTGEGALVALAEGVELVRRRTR